MADVRRRSGIAVLAVVAIACGGEDFTSIEAAGTAGLAGARAASLAGGAGTASGGAPHISGGTANGGAPADGGTGEAGSGLQGGLDRPPGGGAGIVDSNGGASGGASSGGALIGGAPSGGAPSGVTSDGGTSDGGTSDGGVSNGGVSNGGTSSGGTSSGGTSSGGTSSGGTSSGGTSSGGTSSGGAVDPSCEAGPLLDCPCTTSGALACNGSNQKVQLICRGGVWEFSDSCSSTENCDQRTGACEAIVAGCANLAPGATFCEAPDIRHTCGEDRTDTTTETCGGICQNGACRVAVCGDGKVSAGEECDDGNDAIADGCEPGTCRISRVVQLALGTSHTCALLTGGHVRCWGDNAYNQLGLGHTNSRGDYLPYEMGPVDLGGSGIAVKVVAAGNTTCALLSDATLRCWGENTYGQLGRGNKESYFGSTPNTLGAVPVGGRAGGAELDVVDVATGGGSTCALLEGGIVKCWGGNHYGQLGAGEDTDFSATTVPEDIPDVDVGGTAIGIGVGGAHACALLSTGRLRCWGENYYGQLGGIVDKNSLVGDDEKPSEVSLIPTDPSTTVSSFTTGGNHTCALLANGHLECWGRNSVGQLGIGNTTDIGDTMSESPLDGEVFLDGAEVRSVTATSNHTCMTFVSNGGVRCWGNNTAAQLGYPHTAHQGGTDSTIPINLPDIAFGEGVTATAVFPGELHTCAILSTHAVKCWGRNDKGQIGFGFVTTGSPTYIGGSGQTPNLLEPIRVF